MMMLLFYSMVGGISTATQDIADASLSPWHLFIHASGLVKGIILFLVLASFTTWAIAFNKFFLLRRLKKEADAFESMAWSGIPFSKLYERYKNSLSEPFSTVFVAGMQACNRNDSSNLSALAGERAFPQEQHCYNAMDITYEREMNALERGIGMVAMLASVTPFIGLLGTVWGIMDSFQRIAMSQNTNLSVVAPGIAEALFATALGLGAAIPAAIFYHLLTTSIARYGSRLQTFYREIGLTLTKPA